MNHAVLRPTFSDYLAATPSHRTYTLDEFQEEMGHDVWASASLNELSGSSDHLVYGSQAIQGDLLWAEVKDSDSKQPHHFWAINC
jgi:hypothetical protein